LSSAGENFEARIKRNTGNTKALGKIDVEGMYRTEDERRKIENRAAATKAALEDLRHSAPQEDAPREIEDDWLNYFARLAEDKSSQELQGLFGKILSGEIKRPGSFSLKTLQTLATISQHDAETLSNLLSFAISGLIPFETTEGGQPTVAERIFLDDIGIAGNPSQLSGIEMIGTVDPNSHLFWQGAGYRGVLIVNNTSEPATFSLPGQILTTIGKELWTIANSPPLQSRLPTKAWQTPTCRFLTFYQRHTVMRPALWHS
jgi:hypothetical protein